MHAAFVAVPAEEGTWAVLLGLAGVAVPQSRVVHLETLRAGRSGAGPRRRVWIQPEDDVPHVRDRLLRVRDAVGLRPAQVAVAGSLTAAAAGVFGSADLLLCSAAQAADLGLQWRPAGEIALARGFDAAAALGEDADRLRTALRAAVGRCLGCEEDG